MMNRRARLLAVLAVLLGHVASGGAASPGEAAAFRPQPPPMNAGSYPLRQEGKTVFLYGDASATVVCAPLDVCLVALQPGERIQRHGVHIGDAIRWQVKPTVGADETTQVVLKPLASGLETSLALVTDRRTYHMRLVSRKTGSMPQVAFQYPDEVDAAWQAYYRDRAEAEQRRRLPATGEDISTLDFAYTIAGCGRCAWRPQRVYNNGKLTVLQLGPGIHQGDVPALLVQSAQGEALVNYRIQGDRYIVDRVFDRAVLVLGVGRNQERVNIQRRGRRASETPEAFAWLD